jgi:hypothetical protein
VEHKANIGLYAADYLGTYKTRIGNVLAKRFKRNLDKIFLSFGGKMLFRVDELYSDQEKIKSLAAEILPKLKTKEDVLNLETEGIKVGDLIYDTYLRYADKPQLDLKDPYLETLLLQTLNILFVSRKKIEEYNVVALVSSYTTYIYHGIAVRVCLQKNIPVYTVGAYYSLVHKVRKEFPSHANNHYLFKELFEQVKDKETLADGYKEIFENRFKGKIDSATAYMKESAFSAATNTELDGIDWNNTVVVLAHCFFDSPHIYRDLLFPDFYDWMIFTLEELKKQTGLTVLVKQHPNGLPMNEPLFAELAARYANTNIRFIDKKTSQLQIINSRPAAIITAYGTAAAEFAYQGFPVITIYDNPFTSYDFTHLANSKDEYRKLLQDVLKLEPRQHQREILEYYYMQYFFFLQGREMDYMMCAKYKGVTYSESFLAEYLPHMTDSFFQMIDANMAEGLRLCEWETAVLK